jgi:EAL domain-containing protein (putative c-di-GMP-specific phosphodiesterase class I)
VPIPQFTFAFQPIVDVGRRRVYAQEALIRGTARQSAAEILNACVGAELYELDERARAQAIALASRLGLDCLLSINFMPNSLTAAPHSLDHTLAAAEQCSFPIERLILEVTEGEMIQDMRRLGSIIDRCRARGMRVAIDDFGAGYSGLNLLAEFQPDLLKLDMHLIRDIPTHGPRQAIVRGILQTCADLGIDVIAEGVESAAEFAWFKAHEVQLFQGYFFAPPAFECLATFSAESLLPINTCRPARTGPASRIAGTASE